MVIVKQNSDCLDSQGECILSHEEKRDFEFKERLREGIRAMEAPSHKLCPGKAE